MQATGLVAQRSKRKETKGIEGIKELLKNLWFL
jgi:hypothetical protein